MRTTAVSAFMVASADRFLVVLAVVVIVAWAVGRLLRALGQPAVLGEILAGILLGPSVLGALWPAAFEFLFPVEVVGALQVLAEIGLVLFMLLVGIEVDLALVQESGGRAVAISLTGIVVTVLLGAAVSPLLASALMPHASQPGFAMFIGAALGITAFPVLARILQQMRLDRTGQGVLAITCAAIGDVAAWCLLAGIVAVVEASGTGRVLLSVAGAFAFTAIVLLGLRPLLRRLPSVPLAVAVGLALLGAWATSWVGIHAIFGAFLVGVAMPRTPGGAERIADRLRAATTTILLPVFFVVAGLAVEVQALGTWEAMVATGVIVLVAVIGKVGGTSLAAMLGGMAWADAAGLGVLMSTRGLTEIVILAVGLQLGVINGSVYTAMVVMALVTTFAASPLLEWTGIAPRWRVEAVAR